MGPYSHGGQGPVVLTVDDGPAYFYSGFFMVSSLSLSITPLPYPFGDSSEAMSP